MRLVNGCQNFMKSAKTNLRVIIKFTYISFFLLVPFNLHAAHMFKIRTETPSSMNTSDGFFNPKIRVCRGDYTHCDDMADGDCEGVGMTYASAYVDFEAAEPKMCACQVFTCYDALAKGLISASSLFVGGIAVLATLDKDYSKECIAEPQCIPLPLAPGPPPFCDQFESSPEIRVVPVAASDQSFFQPKIRVVIGSPARKCNDGSVISLTASCIDGSVGKTVNSIAENLDVSTDGSERGYTIGYGGEKYIFRTYKEKDQLCAGFYGSSSKGENIMLSSQCFPPPKIDKPELIPIDEKGNDVKLDDMIAGNLKVRVDLDKVKVKIPDYDRNPVTLIYGKGEHVISDLKLKLIKPKIDGNRGFEYYVGCSRGGSFSQDSGCPEGQSIEVGYKENSSGKVTCLVGWNSDEYVLKRKKNNRIFKYLKSSGKQFNDYRIVPIGGKDQYIPCGRSPKDLNTIGQNELDGIKRFKGSYYSIGGNSPTCSDKSLCCRGCLCHDGGDMFSVISKGEQCKNGKVCNANYRTVYKYEDIVHKSEYFNNDPSNPEYSTKYINENTGEPFFLTKEELDDQKGEFFRPKDPYIDGLCVDNFERISYTDPKEGFNFGSKGNSNLKKDPDLKDQYHYFDAKKKQCQFVTMEAWGGGAAGFIGKKNPAKSTSGAAGDYTQATIKVNDERPIFKIKVGGGGKLGQDNGNGSASEVYMCDKDKKNCNKLIVAGGGGNSVETQDAAAVNKNLVYTRFVGRIEGTNESDKIALPYKNGEKTDKIPYSKSVFKKSSACSDSKKSNKVEKVANDNKIAGSGGCINIDKLSYQEGANGKVIITCEQWN